MIFQFKQFAINQVHCTMKVNTDGVLLGALANADDPQMILDIGTGTGVIALMLAQRFPSAVIDAIDIDEQTMETAIQNFEDSIFTNRIQGHPHSFETYFEQNTEAKYDLIVSNPPFFINSLESIDSSKKLARHTNAHFFEQLIRDASLHLKKDGFMWLILPPEVATLVQSIGLKYQLFVQKKVLLHSFQHSTAHRVLIAMSFQQKEIERQSLVIYDHPKKYSQHYQNLLRDFLTIF